jgi:hypothetical protein
MKLKTNKTLTKGPREKLEIKGIRIKLKKKIYDKIKNIQNFYKKSRKKN